MNYAYLNDDFSPGTPESHTMVKVIGDDGTCTILRRDDAPSTSDASDEETAFMHACMHEMKQRHPEMEQDQRVAICLSKWERRGK